MNKARKLIFALLSVTFAVMTQAQIKAPVCWSYAAKRLNKSEAVIFIKATIDQGWHIYSEDMPVGGPMKTSFSFTKNDSYELVGDVKEPEPQIKHETIFNMDVRCFEKNVTFQQVVKIKNANTIISGILQYVCCDDNQCLPQKKISFSIIVK